LPFWAISWATGADPEWVLDTVRAEVERGAVVVRGNHDEAVGQPLERMNAAATLAIEWTRSRLDASQTEFLAALPYSVREGSMLFVHANAIAPKDWGYVRTEQDAERSLRRTDARSIFCGHTHAPALFPMSPMRPPAHFSPLPGREIPLLASRQWLAVIGSVGQPRDGNPAACYALLDPATATLSFHRVPYDVDKAARKVREAGLPESLWMRLLEGR
jgi:diadenosine tetraphosphatase ApaH/serine/threonine PP2A family protein phosphatase